MSRGNLLFAEMFQTSDAPAVEKQRRGRSEMLNSSRNECLIDRFYLYGKYYGLRRDLVIKILSKEFFLSEITIPQILEDNRDKILALKKTSPERQELKNKWPHLDWNPKIMVLEN